MKRRLIFLLITVLFILCLIGCKDININKTTPVTEGSGIITEKSEVTTGFSENEQVIL